MATIDECIEFLFVWPIYTINALVIRMLKITNMASLVAISADSVPSSYLVRITIAPIGTTGRKSNQRWWKVLCMQIIHPKRSQREPMFNIHEMTTMWPMQTLSVQILTWYVENLMFFVVFVINLMRFNFDFFVFKLCYFCAF
jgi:hypothetical protein